MTVLICIHNSFLCFWLLPLWRLVADRSVQLWPCGICVYVVDCTMLVLGKVRKKKKIGWVQAGIGSWQRKPGPSTHNPLNIQHSSCAASVLMLGNKKVWIIYTLGGFEGLPEWLCHTGRSVDHTRLLFKACWLCAFSTPRLTEKWWRGFCRILFQKVRRRVAFHVL